MTASLTDSRFHMWRTVFALAHADGQVTDQERRFMQIYLSRVPADFRQKEILQKDVAQAQDVAVMFAKITVEKDVEDFFNFARLLVWCDGDFGAQESQIMERLRQAKVSPQATENLLTKLRISGQKKSGWLRKMHASVDGLKDIFEMIPGMGDSESGVTNSRFFMWRAVFAIVHADNVVTPEERKYLNGVLAREPFNMEQRLILEKDIDTAQDIAEMFVKIEEQNDRSQFFYHARLVVWSDGDFGEQEQKIMTLLKRTHISTLDFDKVINDLDLKLDDEQKVKIFVDRRRAIDPDAPEGFFRRLLRNISRR